MAEHDLHSVAYPKLDDARMAAIARCTGATSRRVAAGEKLFDVGDRDFKFFVVRSGEVEILEPAGDTPRVVAVHGSGEFTGDVSHLTGTASVVSAVARTDCEVYEVGGPSLRQCLEQSREPCGSRDFPARNRVPLTWRMRSRGGRGRGLHRVSTLREPGVPSSSDSRP
jgi:CRP-like cAMP-binding protein